MGNILKANAYRCRCICFVILHYGDRQVTQLCIESILNMEDRDKVRIVVVDNDAHLPRYERDAFEKLYAAEEKVFFLFCGEGTGFSKANNLGYRYAREQLNADCVIVCNNDIEFIQRDFIKRLEKSISVMQCHVLGPDVIKRDTHEPQNPMDDRLRTDDEARYTIRMNDLALRVMPLAYPILSLVQAGQERNRIKKKKADRSFYSNRQRHIVPFGACLIFTPFFVEKEDAAFLPETQFYYEEYILTKRCFQKGYETGYDPAMKVIHESGSATKGKAGSRYKRMKRLMKQTADSCRIYLEAYTGN